ncbi:MAG: lipoate--protein ligase [Ruthenibacterium sp.]
MMTEISTFVTDETCPYHNLAMEEELLYAVKSGECILYLWQNRNTVVIGRNQNSRAECRIDTLEKDGGFLARRLSGGGAVFHDLGNLNFTFLMREADYDLTRQLNVILRAVQSFGIPAEKTGRNDLTVCGQKFSGNAFYHTNGRAYHHGTLLLDVDFEKLTHYLTVAPDKLASKGVASVRSRVVNLASLNREVTVERMKSALISAFGQEYQLPPTPFCESRISRESLARRTEKFASFAWRIGTQPAASCVLQKRFDWGGVALHLQTNGGIIAQAQVYTDAMDADFAPLVAQCLHGVVFAPNAAVQALRHSDGASADKLRQVAEMMEEWFDEHI